MSNNLTIQSFSEIENFESASCIVESASMCPGTSANQVDANLFHPIFGAAVHFDSCITGALSLHVTNSELQITMRPPPTKRTRPVQVSHTADSVRQVVAQAVLSDDAACATLLESVVGFEKELLDGLVVVLKSFSATKVNLNGPISKILRKYFALIGIETATERYKEFHDFIMNNADTEYASNFVTLICSLLRFCNILRYDKLRQEVVSSFPAVVKLLWKNNLRAEACITARLLAELLLCTKSYHGQENCSDLWFEQVLTKEMERFPYFAALSIMLRPPGSSDGVISLPVLQELSAQSHLCPRSQMVDLLLSYLASFYTRCTAEQMRIFVEFLLRNSLEENNLTSVMGKLKSAVKTVTNNAMDLLIAESVTQLSLEQISAVNKDFNPATIFPLEARCDLHRFGAQQICSDDILKEVDTCLSKMLKIKWPLRKEISAAFMSLAAAYCSLPLHLAPPYFMHKYLVVTALLSTLFVGTDSQIFSSCLNVIEKLAKSIQVLPVQATSSRRLFDSWLASLEQFSSTSEIYKDVANALSAVFVLTKGVPGDKSILQLCPAMDILKSTPTNSCSTKSAVSLTVFFMSTDWESLLNSDDEHTGKVLEKVHSHYAAMLSSVNWKDNESMQRHVEQCCALLSCWDSVPRNLRPALMKKLLDEKDSKMLRRLTTRIIKGKVETENTVLETAFKFHLKYVPLLSDKQHSLEDVLNWNSLKRMLHAGISTEAVFTQLSTEKVKDILSICTTSKENVDEISAIVGLLISSKLKVVENDLLVSFAVMCKKCSPESPQPLSAAAFALEVYGHTDKERDVVSLCFGLLSVLQITASDFKIIRNVQRVLDNAMRYAYPSVNNDQCSVFAQIFIKVFKAVQEFITSQAGQVEEVDELVHGLNSLAHALTLHKIYYSRIVGTIISAVIYQVNELEFAMYKLHSISDRHNASMLATNLPPSERLQYKRLFSTLRRSKKLVT